MAIVKAVISFYCTDEEKPIEKYKVSIKIEEQHRLFLSFRRNVIDFLGLNDKARKFGLGSFDLKLYCLAKFCGKMENLNILSQQQLELELPVLLTSDRESELNGK